MKVLFISFEFGERVSGGLARVVNGVSAELRREIELDVLLLYFSFARFKICARLYRCTRTGPPEFVRAFTRGSVANNCVELAKRERYDVLHFFSVHTATGSMVRQLRSALPEQRIVYSVHSLLKHEQGIRRNPRAFLGYERALVEAATSIHVLNAASLRSFARAYPNRAETSPIFVIPNGVHAGDFSQHDAAFRERITRKLAGSPFTVVCLSRWAHGKGLEHFIAAAERLLAAGHDMRFVLAGRKYLSWEKNWYAYVAKIQRMARRLGPRLSVLGWLDNAQRNTLFELGHACVVPSELEYYPYSVLEPAAAGVPLVASNLPCVQELFSHGKDCLLFRSGDSHDLAQKIADLAGAPQHAAEMAECARRKVQSECDWQSIARDYQHMYRATLALGAAQRERASHESLLPALDASAS